jgi:hypothetical protein
LPNVARRSTSASPVFDSRLMQAFFFAAGGVVSVE